MVAIVVDTSRDALRCARSMLRRWTNSLVAATYSHRQLHILDSRTMELTLKQRQDVERDSTDDILERLGVGCPRSRCRSRSEREEID
jgi:hypothetical protein